MKSKDKNKKYQTNYSCSCGWSFKGESFLYTHCPRCEKELTIWTRSKYPDGN